MMTEYIMQAILVRNRCFDATYDFIIRIKEYENCWRVRVQGNGHTKHYQVSKFDERCLRVRDLG